MNIYKDFRNIINKSDKETFSKRFDEPTYFSFRLHFAPNYDLAYNKTDRTNSYNIMPHPLFSSRINTTLAPPSRWSESKSGASFRYETEYPHYSALNYLEDANEPTRVKMLEEFIEKFNTLQDIFPYYFQSIEGVADLLKIDPTKGQRITEDKKLTITCLEGLDLRMSYLLNLYRKIVWDDVYQRWVLPDMMRYFTLKIYLAEFRTFHLPKIGGESGRAFPYGSERKSFGTDTEPLWLSILDDVLPTWVINCEMCEFDLTDISYEQLTDLNVGEIPNQGKVKFGIKVGNIKEMQIYPVFKHIFLIDQKLNGPYRSKDEITTSGREYNYLYPISLKIAQFRELLDEDHKSGYPYNERANENNVNEADIQQERIAGSTLDVNFKATEPETWVGNAINFGTSYAKNFVKKLIDKGKVTSIPGLGLSYNEIKTAVQSKNVVAALGMIRKGVNEVVQEYDDMPSSKLEQPIQVDNIMRSFLLSLSKSEATDDDTILLKDAANMALSNKGTWEKIKDYSLATDLTAIGEINIDKDLQGTEEYKKIYSNVKSNVASGKIESAPINQETASSKIRSINAKNIIENKPSSKLEIQKEGLEQPIPSKATRSDIQT